MTWIEEFLSGWRSFRKSTGKKWYKYAVPVLRDIGTRKAWNMYWSYELNEVLKSYIIDEEDWRFEE